MSGAELSANLVLILHAAFIAFVVIGLLLIWIGIARGWRWVRNPWFRLLHLLCIAYVVVETWLGAQCPLTHWENELRLQAGETGYESAGFIAHWLHRLIFFTAPPWVFVMCYTLFGLAVIGTFILAPPRWRVHGDVDATRI